MDTKLEEETKKWLEKIEKEIKNIKIVGNVEKEKIDSVIENINAYISDCKHFMEKKDLINAFEAVVYAWAILETCQHLGIFRKE
ncbi:MAG: DUF357 domain-containing protein [Candidatus Aenigmatarchaeota archaeon]|nr:MAG: DUF357 domain-containing protein [Candidatus Aenigmarchaeota archaeon]